MGRPGHIDATVVLVRDDADVTRWPLVGRRCPDLDVVAHLARLQLQAKRLGCRIQLRDVCPDLRALLGLVGLTGVLTGPPRCPLGLSGREVLGEPEGGEEASVEEVVVPHNPTL
ncbi:MAG: hypothetical protein ACRDZ3_14855 [Acidimicrobiia bacterium]